MYMVDQSLEKISCHVSVLDAPYKFTIFYGNKLAVYSTFQVMVKYLLGAEVHMANLVMGTWTISLIQSWLSSLKIIL